MTSQIREMTSFINILCVFLKR